MNWDDIDEEPANLFPYLSAKTVVDAEFIRA